jgi:hypothetical protein
MAGSHTAYVRFGLSDWYWSDELRYRNCALWTVLIGRTGTTASMRVTKAETAFAKDCFHVASNTLRQMRRVCTGKPVLYTMIK